MTTIARRSTVRLDELVDLERDSGLFLGPFERYALLKRSNLPQSTLDYMDKMSRQPYKSILATRQGFAGMDINDANTSAFGARNTSASELNMLQDGTTGASAATAQAIIDQFCTIPPNDARHGKAYELRMGGVYGNTATPTLIITPRWGRSTTPATNISLGASPTWTTISGTTALPYLITFTFVIRTVGLGATASTGYGTGVASMGIPITSGQYLVDLYLGNTAATIDTTGQGTAGCGLTMNATWSASSASNTSTCQWFFIRSLN